MPFRDNRAALIDHILAVYDHIGLKLPKLERDGVPVDIGPFTVFGLFNKGITDATRLKIISGFKEELGIEAPVPQDFGGIPVLNNLSATFYWFLDDREDGDIDTLWDVFVAALEFAAHGGEEARQSFARSFDKALTQHGVKWNLTMGLYWIRPATFISLDSRNRWYITEEPSLTDECTQLFKSLGNAVPNAKEYLHICDVCRMALSSGLAKDGSIDFPSLSLNAWIVSDRVNAEKAAQKKQSQEGPGEKTIGDGASRPVHYWVYSPGIEVSKWDEFYSEDIVGMAWSKVGDIRSYSSREALASSLQETFGSESSYRGCALALWQFAYDVEPGDIVFLKRGKSTIVGRGVVASDYEFDQSRSDEYKNIRHIAWEHRGEWAYPGAVPNKVLADITEYTELVDRLQGLFLDEDDGSAEIPEVEYEPYGEEQFLAEIYLSESSYHTLVDLLSYKKNVILQGAPGVGKTFMAKRLAYSMMGVKDASRVEFIQFHQSYSYEDFIMGYRPNEEGFELKTGAFYDFCKRAADDSERAYFFIIDEINRGNLSKIFGELFMLIESDKRGLSMRLLYSNERFSVPPNVYIIGTMNTADRSLALMDFALRRRYAFFELEPGFDTEGFRSYQESLTSSAFDSLIACVRQLNDAIALDESLGRGYRIGHSFFCGLDDAAPDLAARLEGIVEYELVPLLREYWFDEPDKVAHWEQLLKNSVAVG